MKQKSTSVPTSRQFAQSDEKFRADCEKVGVEPTKRQAAKYRRGEGIVVYTLNPQKASAGYLAHIRSLSC